MPDPHALAALRARALEIFQVGLEAANPKAGIRRALKQDPPQGPVTLIAVGKAACAMMEAALEMVVCKQALVITNYENAREVSGAVVLAAGHPRPDENGLAAAKRLKKIAGQAGEGDQILLLLSGGGSALIPCPIEGVSLADKQQANDVMLSGGLAIEQINLVRQSLSELKGGGLAALAAPAHVRSLILSDVIGDDVRVIASGPSVAPLGSIEDARHLLKAKGLWPKMPKAVQAALELPNRTTPLATAQNQLIGSNTLALDAMSAASSGHIMTRALVGDVEQAAERIAADIRATTAQHLLWGGETTVALQGSGKGGRNQELALRVLHHLKNEPGPWAFMSLGSDGIDGPTDAAGGLVTSAMVFSTLTLTALHNNDAYPELARLNGLIKTGATGTNVADFQIFVRADAPK